MGITEELANYMRRELLAVEGVADVALAGLPEEAIFVEPSSQKMSQLGIDPSVIIGAISESTAINPTGFVETGDTNLRIDGPSGDDSVGDISALTFGFQGEVLNLLDDLRQQLGLCLVFISHDLSVVRSICDEVIVLLEGRQVESGPVVRIFTQPRRRYTQSLIQAVPLPEPDGSWLNLPTTRSSEAPSHQSNARGS